MHPGQKLHFRGTTRVSVYAYAQTLKASSKALPITGQNVTAYFVQP